MNEVTLDRLKMGQQCKVKKVSSCGSIKKRFLDMGLLPGVEIRVVRVAPLGDPVEIVVRGYNLSLRREEARQIIIEVM